MCEYLKGRNVYTDKKAAEINSKIPYDNDNHKYCGKKMTAQRFDGIFNHQINAPLIFFAFLHCDIKCCLF